MDGLKKITMESALACSLPNFIRAFFFFFKSLSVSKSVDKSIMHHLRHLWDHVDPGWVGQHPCNSPRWVFLLSPTQVLLLEGNYSGQAGTDLQVNASNSGQTHNEALPSRGFSAVSPQVTAGNGIF